MKQLIEECVNIFKGKFIFLATFVPLIVAVVFGYIYQNNAINEGSIAVIDLDVTQKSSEIIRKLDASQYVEVKTVLYEEVDPNELLYTEEYLAVVYLPKGLEDNYNQGLQSNIGFYVDMALSAATGNVRAGVTEVFSTENATLTYGVLKGVGLSDERVAGAVAPFSVSQRLLYNPLNKTINSVVLGFINIVVVALITVSTISIVPRLREEGRLPENLNPFGLISRLVPYAIIGVIALYFSLGLLKQIGGMRFEANIYQLWVPVLMFTFGTGLLAMILGWNAKSAKSASARLVLVMFPSVLTGGILLPLQMLPDALQKLSLVLPMSWFFKFLRGMGLRGGDISYFMELLKGFALLLVCLMAIICLLSLAEKMKYKRKDGELTVLDNPNDNVNLTIEEQAGKVNA